LYSILHVLSLRLIKTLLVFKPLSRLVFLHVVFPKWRCRLWERFLLRESRAFPNQTSSRLFKGSQRHLRENNANPFTFQDQVASNRPRAWERAPKSPFANRHKGRKVWKRYDLRAKGSGTQGQDTGNDALDSEETELDGEQPTRSSRPIKRLCLKHAPEPGKGAGVGNANGYITTLRDTAPGTPRRE